VLTQAKTINSFKAKIKACKPHFIQKAMTTQIGKEDAFDKRFKSFMTVFVPKLTPKYLKPHCMLNVSNGNGSTLIRFENPDKVAEFLMGMAKRITTLEWKDKWECLVDISENIVSSGQVFLDEDFVDIDLFKEKWIDDPTLQTEDPVIAIKKQA
jgi:hypothetical protein